MDQRQQATSDCLWRVQDFIGAHAAAAGALTPSGEREQLNGAAALLSGLTA